jgi:hypothetical protein
VQAVVSLATGVQTLFDRDTKYSINHGALGHHINISMKPEFILDRTKSPTQVLCLDRKMELNPVDPRQATFAKYFSQGCDGIVMSSQEAWHLPKSHPWCIRGMKLGKSVGYCWETERTFFYIDNGYIGNISRKTHFRIIKNHVHDIRSVIDRPGDRLESLQFKLKPFTPGTKILLAPPSEKSFTLWNIDQNQWIEQTILEIQKHTERPIEVRLKRNREERAKINTMESALADDVHCLVTYNSVAAVEAVMLGKPAITLGPNAAGVVCSNSINEIENPKIPTLDERDAWLRHLSYSQFTFTEMSDGTAWRIVNEH